MRTYNVYLKSTGQIVGTISTAGSSIFSPGDPAQAHLAGALLDPTSHYIDVVTTPGTPQPATRTAPGITASTLSITANSASSKVTFTGVPSGATVSVDNGTPTAVGAPPVTFSAASKGTYLITFKHFPHLDQSFSVVAS